MATVIPKLFSVVNCKLATELHSADRSIVFPAGTLVEIQIPIDTPMVVVKGDDALTVTLSELSGSEVIY